MRLDAATAGSHREALVNGAFEAGDVALTLRIVRNSRAWKVTNDGLNLGSPKFAESVRTISFADRSTRSSHGQ